MLGLSLPIGRQAFAHSNRAGDDLSQVALPKTGIAFKDRDLTLGQIRIPQEVDLLAHHVLHRGEAEPRLLLVVTLLLVRLHVTLISALGLFLELMLDDLLDLTPQLFVFAASTGELVPH